MDKNRWTALVGLLWLCLLEAAAQRQWTLSGFVKDIHGKPVSAAAVAIQGTSTGTYTDDHGAYALRLAPGIHRVTVTLIGYQPQEVEVRLLKNERLDFVLLEAAIGLETVTVTGKSKTQRLREGAYAVNALDIRSLSSSISSLSDVVNRTTGIRIREEGGKGSDFDLSINGLSGNSIRYFLDGVPLDTKGTGMTLANLPVNLIERIEIYKGVIPASLGTDALGGAINIITQQQQKNFADVSYGTGSFHTHQLDFNGQFTLPKTRLIVRPVLGVNYSKNDYKMKGVEIRNEDRTGFIVTDCHRFHDDYLSLFGQVEAGVKQQRWADEFFVSASIAKTDKELQTGSVQSWVYGMAERNTRSYSLSARYSKTDFLVKGLDVQAHLSQTWDHSATIDTTYRKYYWDGSYINGSYSEIRGRARTWRHYKRPMTLLRTNWEYSWNEHHSLSLNYLLNRTGNRQYDEVDPTYVPTNDVLLKHVTSLSYNQSFCGGCMDNVFFLKEYINHLKVEQTELGTITGTSEAPSSDTQAFWGGGAGSRFRLAEPFAIKASYEHSVRLPIARELLGNGSTIYPNVLLRPECSENFNIGIFGTWQLGRNHRISYEANGFVRLVDDYIQATVTEQEGMMQYENVEAVHVKGIEGEIRYDWNDHLHLMANASYQDARDQQAFKKDGKPSVTYKNRTPNKPWAFANAEAAYTFHNVGLPTSRLKLSMDYQWIHWFYLTWEAYGSSKTKARVPSQHITNASLLYSWNQGRYNLSVECTNLFDKLAYDNYMLQKPGRAFFAKIRLFLH